MGRAVRCLIHIPVGVLNAFLFSQNVHIGWAFLIVFMIYEVTEDWRLKDHAYIDIFGWLVGFPVKSLIEFLF